MKILPPTPVFYVSAAAFAVGLLAIAIEIWNFIDLKKHDEGTGPMRDYARRIREGVRTFLNSEYERMIVSIAIIAVIFAIFSEIYAGLCLATGALIALIASDWGVRATTWGNVRTTNAARVKLKISRTTRIAAKSAGVGAISIHACGLLGFLPVSLICFFSGPGNIGINAFGTPTNVMSARLLGFSLGFSICAIFARVGGGIYTKAADVGADLVGKVEFDLPEDSPMNACAIGDAAGDNLSDAYANYADLGESTIATLASGVIIAIQTFYGHPAFTPTFLFVIALTAGGLFSSIISVQYVILKNRRRYKWVLKSSIDPDNATAEELEALALNTTRPGKSGEKLRVEYSPEIKNPGRELTTVTFMAASLTIILGAFSANCLFGNTQIAEFRFGWISPIAAATCGIASSVMGGLLTDLYTNPRKRYVTDITKMAKESPALAVTEGLFVGNHSTFVPTLIIAAAILAAYLFAGFYGVAVSAVGVLAFVGTTLTIDALGAVADNAGAIAVMSGLAAEVRKLTDELDALGNTTAAVGKFNAIAAAAFSTLTMLVALIGNVPSLNLNAPDQFVIMIIGAVIGAVVIREFASILIKSTAKAAYLMAREAERQIRELELLEPENTKMPDYNLAIRIVSKQALRNMVKPALLAVFSPLVVGALMGPAAMLGLLIGAIPMAICEALFNSNAGGAWDNAKKAFEMEIVQGDEDAHKSAVICDTIGDFLKDVVAVCLDICVKIMATVATATVSTFFAYNLLAYLLPC